MRIWKSFCICRALSWLDSVVTHDDLYADDSQSDRLNEIVDRALVKDLLTPESPFALVRFTAHIPFVYSAR